MAIKSLFFDRSGQAINLVIAMTLSVTLIYIDVETNTLNKFRQAIGTTIVEPVKFFAKLPSTIIRSSRALSTSRETLSIENQNLKLRIRQLEGKILTTDGVAAENIRLRNLLNSTENFELKQTVAEIVTIDLDPFKQIIALNKGKKHNVQIGQVVVDRFGVMGQITHLTHNTSTTLLISDTAHSLPVQIQSSGLRTLANGTGRANELDLKYIARNSKLEEGDTVITSGLGGIYPKNYPVGVITQITEEPGKPFLTVKVKPFALLNRSREVLILNMENIE